MNEELLMDIVRAREEIASSMEKLRQYAASLHLSMPDTLPVTGGTNTEFPVDTIENNHRLDTLSDTVEELAQRIYHLEEPVNW